MPRRGTAQEEEKKRRELVELYVRRNMPIGKIADMLGLAEVTVYDRLIRLNIKIQKELKPGYTHPRNIPLPPYSGDLAEFCGIMLGDGNIGTAQLRVTVNAQTDLHYVPYVQDLFERLFAFRPRVTRYRYGRVDLYLTSASLVRCLSAIGLHSPNKVRDQVGVPAWIFDSLEYRWRFVRGFFDTDGSIYRLKHFNAMQMSFRNRSIPLLNGTRQALLDLGYHPSQISNHSVYLTRRTDIRRYVGEIGFGNVKHQFRARAFGVLAGHRDA
jgi:hypothetical protein